MAHRLALLILASLLAIHIGSQPRATYAAGVVGTGTAASCTAALSTALGGGGTITFNCGGPAVIVLTQAQAISTATSIDGGGQITLSGGNTTRLFEVSGGSTLTLRNITLTNGTPMATAAPSPTTAC